MAVISKRRNRFHRVAIIVESIFTIIVYFFLPAVSVFAQSVILEGKFSDYGDPKYFNKVGDEIVFYDDVTDQLFFYDTTQEYSEINAIRKVKIEDFFPGYKGKVMGIEGYKSQINIVSTYPSVIQLNDDKTYNDALFAKYPPIVLAQFSDSLFFGYDIQLNYPRIIRYKRSDKNLNIDKVIYEVDSNLNPILSRMEYPSLITLNDVLLYFNLFSNKLKVFSMDGTILTTLEIPIPNWNNDIDNLDLSNFKSPERAFLGLNKIYSIITAVGIFIQVIDDGHFGVLYSEPESNSLFIFDKEFRIVQSINTTDDIKLLDTQGYYYVVKDSNAGNFTLLFKLYE